jgi:hypothetical protein
MKASIFLLLIGLVSSSFDIDDDSYEFDGDKKDDITNA